MTTNIFQQLRDSLMIVHHPYQRGISDTSYYISAEILITRRVFAPNIHTGERKPTIYALTYAPTMDFSYSIFQESIYIVDTDLTRIFETFEAKLIENSQRVYLEYC